MERIAISLPLPIEVQDSMPALIVKIEEAQAALVRATDEAYLVYIDQRARRDPMRLGNHHRACDEACAQRDATLESLASDSKLHPLVAWIVREMMPKRFKESLLILKCLAMGHTLANLKAVAEEREWCSEWDDALSEALRRFDILSLDYVQRDAPRGN